MAISEKIKIDSINPDLFSGEINPQNGETLYFGFEKVDQGNIKFWRRYEQQAGYMATYCDGFCRSATETIYPDYPNKFSDTFDYTLEEYNDVMQFIQRKGYFKESPFDGIKGGISGMSQVLSVREDQRIYAVYASTVPVTKCHSNDLAEKTVTHLADYTEMFGDIVMSFVFRTEDEAPTVSHYGIFRNPTSFLDIQERYKGLSMKLHGFSATIAKIYFIGKKYMVTNPMPSMSEIMTQRLGKGSIHIGTNEDLKEFSQKDPKKQELLTNFPPIYYREGAITKIAIEGINLSDFPDTLPDEKAEFISKPGKTFDFSGWTIGSMTTVTNLDKLSEFFIA